MIPLKLEQSDTTNRNKTENGTTKIRTIRYIEQQKKKNVTTKTRAIRCIEQQ
jgi:hypothetical protein